MGIKIPTAKELDDLAKAKKESKEKYGFEFMSGLHMPGNSVEQIEIAYQLKRIADALEKLE